MEIKWLEDFMSVAARGHFAKAAEDRYVTQSALSRRIKALELWVGAELFDRSQHPIQLTEAGHGFIATAEQIIKDSYAARIDAQKKVRADENTLTLSCLHTLALFFVPGLISSLKQQRPALRASIIAETRTVEEYLAGLASGESDLFLSYSHPVFDFRLEGTEFQKMNIGTDLMSPFARKDCLPDASKNTPVPVLVYSATTFMHRVVDAIIPRVPYRDRLKPVYTATLAESLFGGVQEGLGMAWLPETLLGENLLNKDVVKVSDELSEPMTITIYRSVNNKRAAVDDCWAYLASLNDTD